jgi:hypothetical protein
MKNITNLILALMLISSLNIRAVLTPESYYGGTLPGFDAGSIPAGPPQPFTLQLPPYENSQMIVYSFTPTIGFRAGKLTGLILETSPTGLKLLRAMDGVVQMIQAGKHLKPAQLNSCLAVLANLGSATGTQDVTISAEGTITIPPSSTNPNPLILPAGCSSDICTTAALTTAKAALSAEARVAPKVGFAEEVTEAGKPKRLRITSKVVGTKILSGRKKTTEKKPILPKEPSETIE